MTLAPRGAEALVKADAVFATAYQNRDGQYGVAVLSETGQLVFSATLPDRGHDVTFDPISRRSVVFARQPGTFAVVFDHGGQSEPMTIASAEGRHFFGHGVFSHDGALLYATENDFDNAAGTVGIYDARDDFRRLGEFPTHGVGPHELVLLDDGRTLAIANGGIETHPDFGRAELNLATMKPSLALIDRISGDLRALHELPPKLHQLSIRHMDVSADGVLWFGCQYRGPATDQPPLVGLAPPGEEPKLIELPTGDLTGLRNYVGSVAANRASGMVAISSPQGNSFLVLDAATGAVRSRRTLTEVCGLAPDAGGFLATTGTGIVLRPDGTEQADRSHVWDNHLLRIG